MVEHENGKAHLPLPFFCRNIWLIHYRLGLYLQMHLWLSTRMARCNGPCPSSAGTSGSSITDLVGTYRPNCILALDSHNWVCALGPLWMPLHGSLRPAILLHSFDAKFWATRRASVLPPHIDLASATLFGFCEKTTGSPSRTITTLTADSLLATGSLCELAAPH